MRYHGPPDPAESTQQAHKMMLDTEALILIDPDTLVYAQPLAEACERYQINTPLRQCHFLAQMAVESAGFTKVVESFNYREDKLVPLFGVRRISEAQAKLYGRSVSGKRKANQEALANILYGGEWGRRNLGNTEPGDGWRYRGRGLKQITGRANYRDISMMLYNVPELLLEHPEWLERNDDAAWSAGAFWDMKHLNELADRDDVVEVTKRVNGGQNGLQDRKRWLHVYKQHLL